MRVRRLPVIDEYVDSDQAAVLVDGHVVVLSVVATAVLHAAGDEWTTIAAITRAVVDAIGTPEGDPELAVAAIAGDLAGVGLVETAN